MNLHHVLLYFDVDSKEHILLMPFQSKIMEVKSWCVRGKIGRVDVDLFKQVTQVSAESSGRIAHVPLP